jgi:hypothetical protein
VQYSICCIKCVITSRKSSVGTHYLKTFILHITLVGYLLCNKNCYQTIFYLQIKKFLLNKCLMSDREFWLNFIKQEVSNEHFSVRWICSIFLRMIKFKFNQLSFAVSWCVSVFLLMISFDLMCLIYWQTIIVWKICAINCQTRSTEETSLVLPRLQTRRHWNLKFVLLLN